MLIDDLRERLKEINTELTLINTFWQEAHFTERFARIDAQITDERFWQHPERDVIMAQHHALKERVDQHTKANQDFKNYTELVELFQDDETEIAAIEQDVYALRRQISRLKLHLLLGEPEDEKSCYLSINSGAGGTESQDWANMLLRMFLRFAERENFSVQVLELQDGEEAGIKSCTMFVRGKFAYGFLKAEAGIHRLVRISPFDSNKRRHTSFAAVTVIPEVKDEKIEINEADLRIETFRAGGAGGQHVNKTESAVRIIHIPTGLVAQCQNERSQQQNKQAALKMLKARIVQRQEDEKRAKENSVEKKKIEWGSQIRSYVLHPYKMVKDHRTGYETFQPDAVLDGDLMQLIEAYLLMVARGQHPEPSNISDDL